STRKRSASLSVPLSLCRAYIAALASIWLVLFSFNVSGDPRALPSFPTRRSSDLDGSLTSREGAGWPKIPGVGLPPPMLITYRLRSEEHTSELQSLTNLVCRLLLEKKDSDPIRPGPATSLTHILPGQLSK